MIHDIHSLVGPATGIVDLADGSLGMGKVEKSLHLVCESRLLCICSYHFLQEEFLPHVRD